MIRRALAIGFIIIMVLGITGCCQAPFVRGVDKGVSTLCPEYVAYIEADGNLSPATKDIRKATCDELRRLIEEAKK